jgi:PAS domain S-box-containing protein
MAKAAQARAFHLQALGRFVLLLALPVVIGVVMWIEAVHAQRHALLVQHTLQVELSLARLLSDVKIAVSRQREFLLTGKPELRDRCRAAQDAAQSELVQLANLTADNPRQQPPLANLQFNLARLIAEAAKSITQPPSADSDLSAVQTDMEREIGPINNIEVLVNQMSQEEERLLLLRRAALNTAAEEFYWWLLLGYALIILIVASLYRSVKRYSTKSAQAEARLAAVNAELEERVKHRTALLRTREELLTTFVQYVPAGVAMLDRNMHYLQVSDRWCSMFGIERERFIGHSHYEIFPDIPDRWKLVHQRCLQGETLSAEEDSWERDGQITWLCWETRPWGSRDGLPEGMLVFGEDITARKQAEANLRSSEQKLRDLAARLLAAQEEERTKLARELHDDVTQQLAFLSIELGRLAGELPDTAIEARGRVQALQKQLLRASSEIRRISHGLHPSVITDFGLSVALEEFCEEFGNAHGIRAVFEGLEGDSRLNQLEATCLYRIAQESMHNAVLHGHAGEVKVTLQFANNQLQLQVRDDGIGFPEDHAQSKAGLGIASMIERARLVNGTLHISSAAGHGTTVTVSLPLKEDRHGESKDSPR